MALTMNYAMSPQLIEIQEKLNSVGYAQDPDCAQKLTSRERMALTAYLLAQKIRVDNQFYQYQQGLLDEEYFRNNFKAQVVVFGPGWKMFTGPTRPSFEQKVDEILSQSERQQRMT